MVWWNRRSAVELRIGIFHDYLKSIGGGELVTISLAKAFDAHVFTTNFNREVLRMAGAEDVRVTDLGRLTDLQPIHQIQASLIFAGVDLDDFDLYVFCGNWCRTAGRRHQPNLFYCYAPVRMFYDLKEHTLNKLKPPNRIVAAAWIGIHSRWDRSTMRHMNLVVADSENVKGRLKRYLGRDSIVVYPPTPTGSLGFEETGDFWLSVNRLYPEKRIEMQVEIFRRLPGERLLIVGDAETEETPRRLVAKLDLPPNVELLGSVDRRTLEKLYARCKGHITTAMDEDFGMTPVEAMAAGKVVLATDEGGYRETVVDGETGWLLPASVDAFVEKIASIRQEDLESMRDKCIARSRLFDEGMFVERMRRLIRVVVEKGGRQIDISELGQEEYS